MPETTPLMPQPITFANARLILADHEVTGRITLKGPQIVEIIEGTAIPAGSIDCGGDIVAPGLIELHTDNIERHLQPRPGVDWPHNAAI